MFERNEIIDARRKAACCKVRDSTSERVLIVVRHRLKYDLGITDGFHTECEGDD